MHGFYRYLIRFHPPVFRERFEDELIWIFSEAERDGNAHWFVLDAMASLFRQWFLRRENRMVILNLLSVTVGVACPLVAGFGAVFFLYSFAAALLIGPATPILITISILSAAGVSFLGLVRFFTVSKHGTILSIRADANTPHMAQTVRNPY
jgi:hypothetical protein